jgi:hypothetical protein
MKPNPLIHLSRFDLASRGPWGATRLILSPRGQHIACLGAAITVLALGSGPFIQQVVMYDPCPQVAAGLQASISRTNNYTTHGFHTGVGESSLDPPMQAAIYEGAYHSYSPVAPFCPTGNCTFPDYRTVGMCNVCEDISDTIIRSCITLPSWTLCNFTLPSGLTLDQSHSGDERMIMSTNITASVLAVSQIMTYTQIFEYNQTSLFNVTHGTLVGNNDLPTNIIAIQCSLFPCVRTYAVEVVQNQNNEVLLDTSKMIWQTDVDLSMIETTEQLVHDANSPHIGAPMPCLLDGNYYEASSFTERNEINTWAVMGLLPNNAIAYLPSDCVFENSGVPGLVSFLPTFLSGFAAEAPYVSYAEPDWMLQLFNNFNVTLQTINSTWAAIADSMIMHIRRSGDPSNSVPTAGVVYRTDTCISVQWPWLIFPAALLLLTLVFMLAPWRKVLSIRIVKSGKDHCWRYFFMVWTEI